MVVFLAVVTNDRQMIAVSDVKAEASARLIDRQDLLARTAERQGLVFGQNEAIARL